MVSWLFPESGKLYSFGANGEGQLGLGHTDNVSRPTVIESLEDQQYTKLAAGADHSVILTGILVSEGIFCRVKQVNGLFMETGN